MSALLGAVDAVWERYATQPLAWTPREAYRFLQKTSQDKNTPMVELARKILLAAPLLQKE